jgi:ligand-binding sensor domain-containing protein/signal transduction histidine kinase
MLALLFAISGAQTAWALDPAKAITQYVHSTWRTDEGLPLNAITRILETRDGYLWIGSQNGLARFDGVRFAVFDNTNTTALPDNWISDLVEDRQGTLWIATSHGGLTYLRDGRFAHLNGMGNRAAQTLAVDADGSVWVGGAGGLAHLSNGKVIKSYTTTEGLSGNQIRRVLVDKDRSIWIATNGGLSHLVAGRMESYSKKDGLPNNDVLDLHLGADGTLRVKTENAETSRWVHGHFESWKIPGVPGPDVRDMLEDRNGNLWIAGATEGLWRVNGQRVDQFTIKDGLSSETVACLYEDKDGNLWAGTDGGGLERFRDGSITTFAKEEGLSTDSARAVLEDSAGDIWITTSTGLNQLHGNHIRVFTTADGLPTNDVWPLWEDHQQNLLIGTLNKGLVQMAPGTAIRKFSAHDSIPAHLDTAILKDSAHQLWTASSRVGLTRYADGQKTALSKANGLLSNSLFALTEGAKGTIWIATSDGLNSIHEGRIQNYPATDGPLDAWVVTLLFDSRNILWIGTLERGLFRFEGGRFTHYSTSQGLADNTIGSILEDTSGNLWISSNKGISRLDRGDLNAVANGTRTTVKPVVFGKADGMKSSDMNSGTQPSAWRGRDGRLWFSTTRGIVVIDPAHLSFNGRPLSTRVEGLLADEINVDLAMPVRLAPTTRRLEIRYTAPNLSSPERTRFRYRLDGFDEQWVAGGAQRVAQYTNLSPGHYTFRVGARVEGGSWSTQEAALHFDLDPQFYQTWWFRLLCAFSGLTLVWAAYRLRVGWLHARTAVLEERQRIASEIHDSLAQGLSGIIFQNEAALYSMPPGDASTRVTTALNLAKSSLDSARYSVWDLSPPVLDQKSLVESIPFMARQLSNGRVESLEISFTGLVWSLRPEANHHIVMIAQEAISNAIQHGHAHTIAIKVTYAPDSLQMSVADDGSGFTPNAAALPGARGYGMRNMRHRAKRLGATLDVSSEVGKGTQIELSVPRPGRFKKAWFSLLGKDVARIDG